MSAPPETSWEVLCPDYEQFDFELVPALAAMFSKHGPTEAAGRKRKSRWRDDPSASQLTEAPPSPAVDDPSMPKKSRWSTKKTREEVLREVMSLRQRMEELSRKISDPLPYVNASTSPSPPPAYDGNGMRTNTRIQRIRDRFVKEKNDLLQQMLKLDPQLAAIAPAGAKPSAKLMVPEKQYPQYNFVGLLLGPRGNTHRRMEAETGCKIQIRGRGATKNETKRRLLGPQPGEDEELHVFITGETVEKVERARDLVQKLLTPIAEEFNQHKAKQLRELAEINGTTKGLILCRICGEPGHTIQTCPNRQGSTWTAANVRCDICNADNHVTADCPMANAGWTGDGNNPANLNNEYDSFMNDLLGDGSSSGRPVGLIEGAGGADAGALVLSTSSGGTDIDALLKAQGPSVADIVADESIEVIGAGPYNPVKSALPEADDPMEAYNTYMASAYGPWAAMYSQYYAPTNQPQYPPPPGIPTAVISKGPKIKSYAPPAAEPVPVDTLSGISLPEGVE